jgi:hypothetical protein
MNWGWKIALVYVGFITMILTLVTFSSKEKIDLVREDYYKKELKHQDQLDAESNYAKLPLKPTFTLIEDSIQIEVPSELSLEKCTVYIYCPSKMELDSNYNIEFSDHLKFKKLKLPEEIPARFNIEITWESKGQRYFHSMSFPHE